MANSGSIVLDTVDKKILEVLQDNARLSLRQIAKRVHVSVATVQNRIRKLEDEGVIKKYAATLDYEKIGYEFEALIEIKISKGTMDEIEQNVSSHPNVFATYDITGDFDTVALARFGSRRKFDTFIKNLQLLNCVERTKTKLIVKTIREKATDLHTI